MRQLKQLLMVPILGAVMAVSAPALAEGEPSVVELFTSQGCSSCPAADKLFKHFADRKDLVALSFNVDYWDYLGWKDTLAKNAYTLRQRSYADQRGDGAVYTPQVIVNGLAHVIGSKKTKIEASIAETRDKLSDRRVPIQISATGGTFAINIHAAKIPPRKPATVWLATVEPSVSVKIKHGENRGRTITYYNVVRHFSVVGMWSGEAESIKLQERYFLPKKSMRCAVLLQADDGSILAAAWITSPDQPQN
jgi:hypothetical protein